jgi:hypothetical protein
MPDHRQPVWLVTFPFPTSAGTGYQYLAVHAHTPAQARARAWLLAHTPDPVRHRRGARIPLRARWNARVEPLNPTNP